MMNGEHMIYSLTTQNSFTSSLVPFPGIEWLQRIATNESAYTWNGKTFTSAYDAIMEGDATAKPCRNLNAYFNSFFLSSLVAERAIELTGSVHIAHYLLCYLRNFVAAFVIYYGTAGIFHYFCYVHPMSKKTFEGAKRIRPAWSIMWDQIKLSQASMAVYVLLPVVDEWMVESGYTRVYHTVAEIGGWPYYTTYMLLYFMCVEVGIYWMHRTLHTNKWLYKNVHMLHHKYNKPETLTPWCSIAFHPVDGILQASPYVVFLPIVPCHYLTHFMLLFFTAIWATYIHDAMDFNVDPIMGSKYHTVHHTHYIYNYGQVFQFCDWFWGTLRVPDGPTGQLKTAASRRATKKVV
jgi:lathosterol oxidase